MLKKPVEIDVTVGIGGTPPIRVEKDVALAAEFVWVKKIRLVGMTWEELTVIELVPAEPVKKITSPMDALPASTPPLTVVAVRRPESRPIRLFAPVPPRVAMTELMPRSYWKATVVL
jgi:hypothetical protein